MQTGLSQLRIKRNQEEIVKLLKSTKRDGIDKLVSYLEKHDYFSAPASTKYHLSCVGGLAQHSLNVYRNMMQLVFGDNWASLSDYSGVDNISHDSIILVALLHDLCKVDFYTLTSGRKKVDGVWVDSMYYTVDEQVPILGHGSKSVILIQQFIRLYVDEIQAISFHMGLQDSDSSSTSSSTISGVYCESRLALFTHLADLRATFAEDWDCLNWADEVETPAQETLPDEDGDLPF